MKLSPNKIPLVARSFLFLLGIASAALPITAICKGAFRVGGKSGPPFDISQSHNPVCFWVLAFVFLFLSACIFYVCFAKRLPDA
jgi:Na+-driven multidrug efflux pump